MARQPIPGADNGTWGNVLNEYLSVAHDSDGTLKVNAVPGSALQDSAVTSAKVAPSLARLLTVTIRRTAATNPQWVDNTGAAVDPAAIHAAGFGINFVCEEGYEPTVGTAGGQAKAGRDLVFQINT